MKNKTKKTIGKTTTELNIQTTIKEKPIQSEIIEQIKIDPTINTLSSDIPTIEKEPILSQISKTDYIKLKNEKNPNIPRIKPFGIQFIKEEGIKQDIIEILGGEYTYSIYRNRGYKKDGTLTPKNELRDLLQKDTRTYPRHKEENDRIRNLLDSIR